MQEINAKRRCPHPGLLREYKGSEKQILAGQMGEQKAEIAPEPGASPMKVPGVPGQIDDGFAILLRSLEDFPYERYGLA